MKLGLGRVIKADGLENAVPVSFAVERETPPRGQLVRREVLEAAERARALVAAAEARAAKLLDDAERAAAELHLRAETEARADAAAAIATQALALRQHEARADERALERSVELARLLAERLLGESLHVAPEQVVAL
ncbi:MAG TPA: hypothetical protein VFK05_01725, partial [Polyangiaceae bacterium]|nr:hypothetical protein [Polyangiaceae bacterium]